MTIVLIMTLLVVAIIILWALFSGNEKIIDTPKDQNADFALRRRASDKAIEEEFPESSTSPRRRKNDPQPDRRKTKHHPFQLPYLSDDIISNTSRFRVYKRTLVNSEIYAQKGDFSTAVSLYSGVHSRIQDSDVRYKINSNIEYIKNYQQDLKTGKADEDDANLENEVKFKVDGQMPNQINIGLVDTPSKIDAESLANNIAAQIRDEIREKEKIKDELQKIKSIQEDNRIKIIKSEMDALNLKLDTLVEKNVPESNPAVIQAKYESPVPLQLDPGPILEILDRLPGKTAPHPPAQYTPPIDKGQAVIPGPETSVTPHTVDKANTPPANEETVTNKERVVEKEADEFDDNEFELISNLGKDKDEDSLSDEEIFEKILKEDEKVQDQDSFEIIGDKRDDTDEYDILDKKQEKKQREEENFYRKLIKTDKRMKRELPILKVSYDFSRLPDEFSLSREKNILEYSFYKFKPMLEKAADFIKRRRVRDAINYYKVVLTQNIPPEFKTMIRRNINDLTEYLEKYFSGD